MNKIFNNYKCKIINLINLDKHNPKYLVPISPILLLKYFHNNKVNYYNFINLDKPNTKYLASISLILFFKKYLFQI